MDREQIIRQSFKMLGINRSDMNLNSNVYYRNAIEELEDMKKQILTGFEFQVKFSKELARLPVEDFPNLYKDGVCLIARVLPSDFYSIREVNDYSGLVQIKGNVVYIPEYVNKIEYYSSAVEYEDIPSYAELYIVYCLSSRLAMYMGRDNSALQNNAEMQKILIMDIEKRNTSFSYNGNTLVRW